MPPPAVQSLRDLMYWQYAKILSSSAGMGKRQHHFVLDRFHKLREGAIAWGSIDDYVKQREDSSHCVHCGRPGVLTLDTLFPRTLHGPKDGKNSVWVCGACRESKGARRLYEYWVSLGGLDAAKYNVPHVAEGKYLSMLHDTFEGAGVLDLDVTELHRRFCASCDLGPTCRREGTVGKLSPLCLDGVATVLLAGGKAARRSSAAQARRAAGPRWQDENRDGVCDRCNMPLDGCKCVCPFCGESKGCECAIGPDAATGGG